MTLTDSPVRSLRLVYFAWVRERVGRGEETVAPPPGIETVRDLARWLKSRGDGYAAAFADEAVIRAAIDRSHARPDAPIAGAREIAFFPPMTGG
jgi:molybdopterin synthase sulfur carrier subunit